MNPLPPGWGVIFWLLGMGAGTWLLMNEVVRNVRAIVSDIQLRLARRRAERNTWKKRPFPADTQPHVGTYATRQLLRDADLTHLLRIPSQREHELPAESKGEAA